MPLLTELKECQMFDSNVAFRLRVTERMQLNRRLGASCPPQIAVSSDFCTNALLCEKVVGPMLHSFPANDRLRL